MELCPSPSTFRSSALHLPHSIPSRCRVSPVSPMAKSPTWDLLIVSAGGAATAVVNVAVTVSAPAGIVNVQVAPDAVHAVGVPLHPPNAPPVGGVSVKVTCLAYTGVYRATDDPCGRPTIDRAIGRAYSVARHCSALRPGPIYRQQVTVNGEQCRRARCRGVAHHECAGRRQWSRCMVRPSS